MAFRNKILEFPNKELLHEQAAEWVARIEAGDLTPVEAQAIRDWANQSEAHRQILVDTARVWDRMEVMSGLSELFSLDNPPRRQWTSPRIATAAAVIAGVCVFVFIFQVLYQPSVRVDPAGVPTATAKLQSYDTGIGESDVITLPDGSIVKLNTGTRIEVDFSVARRLVVLVEGEAYFEVARNEKLPFVVTADGTSLRAHGTAFNVYKMADDRLEIMVTDGLVQLIRNETDIVNEEATTNSPVLLRAGQMAQIDRPGVLTIEEIRSEEIARKLLWQQKMLAFDGSPLGQVIAEFSRYTTLKIDIADAETAAIRVGGYFRSEDIAGLLTSLEENFAISVQQTAPDRFSLRKNRQ